MEDESAGRGAGFDLFGQRFKIDLALFELCDKADEIGKIASEPIKPPYNEGVSLAQAFEASFQLRSASVLPAGLFFIDLSAFGVLEGMLLQVESLVVGRDTGRSLCACLESYQGRGI